MGLITSKEERHRDAFWSTVATVVRGKSPAATEGQKGHLAHLGDEGNPPGIKWALGWALMGESAPWRKGRQVESKGSLLWQEEQQVQGLELYMDVQSIRNWQLFALARMYIYTSPDFSSFQTASFVNESLKSELPHSPGSTNVTLSFLQRCLHFSDTIPATQFSKPNLEFSNSLVKMEWLWAGS